MKIFFPQPLNSQALDLLEIIRVLDWEGLNFSSGRKDMDPLCTNKLTQGKCQRLEKFCCSGGKTKIIFLDFESGLETSGWLKVKGVPLLLWRRAWDPMLSSLQPLAGCSSTGRQKTLKRTLAWVAPCLQHHLPAAWRSPWVKRPKKLMEIVRGSTSALAWSAWESR